MEINEISGQIVDAAMKVHSALGPGLLERFHFRCVGSRSAENNFGTRFR